MDFIVNLFVTAFEQALGSLVHNWPFLLVGIFISALLKAYIDTSKISAFLKRFRGLGVLAATGAAVGTPFCSCGTTAVVLGMMATTMPWAPIVAFMVASPLTSPEELLYSAGLFGWPFALAFFLASILLGLAGGGAAALLESRGLLANQTRFSSPKELAESSCACSQAPAQPVEIPLIRLDSLELAPACSCAASTAPASSASIALTAPLKAQSVSVQPRPAARKTILPELYASARQLLPMFLGFAFIGYLLNGLIPTEWVAALFGSGRIYSVPLAATLSLPLYINTEGSLPLVRALLENGMSQGAALAFLIAGSGTSIGAIGGALTIARWRIVALVIFVLWAGAILAGYGYDFLLGLNLF